jgi:hypothetical protein
MPMSAFSDTRADLFGPQVATRQRCIGLVPNSGTAFPEATECETLATCSSAFRRSGDQPPKRRFGRVSETRRVARGVCLLATLNVHQGDAGCSPRETAQTRLQ